MPRIEDDIELRLFFLDEAEALAASILESIQGLILGSAGDQASEDIRRGFHTLKGGAVQIAGCDSLADCAEKGERLAQGMVRKIAMLSPALLGLLADATRANIELILQARKDGNMPDYPLVLRGRLEDANQRLREAELIAMSAAEPSLAPLSIVDLSV